MIDSGDYLLTSCTIPGGGNMIVTGKARLYCVGKFTVSGSGYVYLKPGAEFQLYTGDDTTISGGGVVNGSERAANFVLYGLPSLTKLTYSGSAPSLAR